MTESYRTRNKFPLVTAVLFLVLLTGRYAFAQQFDLPSSPALHPERSATTDLESDLQSIFNDPRFSNATWGVAVRSLETGEYLFRMNDGKSLLPASNFKLLPACEALSLLGPDFRYTTELLTTGRITGDGVLRGDLIIRGSGDPSLGVAISPNDSSAIAILDALADSLSERGIRRIDGAIIGDDSYFTSDNYPNGWAVEDLPFYYAMQTSALVFNADQVSVNVTPGVAKGSAVKYELNPNTDYVSVENYGSTKPDSITMKRHRMQDSVLQAGSSSIEISRELGTNTVTIEGEIPLHGTAVTQQISVEDPTLYTATLLRETLEDHGITVTGEAKTLRDRAAEHNAKPYPYLKARVLVSAVSPPMRELIKYMNKQSDNLFAEQLFRTAAKEIGGEGSWPVGAEVMKRFLASLAIDTTHLQIADGSGLSRMDLINADQMTGLLVMMHEKPQLFEDLYNSLPIMGVDGTLASRLKGTVAEGNVHAKTGFLTGARTISGYLTTRDGEQLAFSMMCNNYTVPVREASNVQDVALLRLVNFTRR